MPMRKHGMRRHEIRRPNAQIIGAMNKLLITFGIVLVALGLLWPWLGRLGLGRLPGDIVIERAGFTLYLPITTSLIASLVLSLLLWWLGR